MANSQLTAATKKAFKHHFESMVPLLLSEWPQLTKENLAATEGDVDSTVVYISDETDRTKTLVRRQINELATLVEVDAPAPGKVAANGASSASLEPAGPLGIDKSSIDNLLDDLESRTENLIQELKAEMLPELEKRARGNLGQSLLIALGIGFVLGLILRGKRG
ncbi:MAG: hypothetical protein DCF21_13405 [Leptolyngbya sp.]|jgi:LPS O-antigen subunit length determinant protein (WzzB/FepE family)|uniref:DUF883 domain-containing protein n=1 Tax=Shackletoniella antarctica TaxID=268115 RepID=A0A2W4WGV8_9CYAN|nr:MAG: hypothetical protein DCF17_04035 [Shackletoniella antarctica]PZV14056.1 MAG: hypothetical protein DCF21_13405 [Leptolyngbya sp.]